MIDHLSFYPVNFEATRRFYDAALGALGYRRVTDLVASWNPDWPTQRMCAYGPEKKGILWLMESRTPHTPGHVAFAAPGRKAVDAFHAAGLEAGGMDNGKPGPRTEYSATYYAAFLFDPDVNNVEAVTHAAD